MNGIKRLKDCSHGAIATANYFSQLMVLKARSHGAIWSVCDSSFLHAIL